MQIHTPSTDLRPAPRAVTPQASVRLMLAAGLSVAITSAPLHAQVTPAPVPTEQPALPQTAGVQTVGVVPGQPQGQIVTRPGAQQRASRGPAKPAMIDLEDLARQPRLRVARTIPQLAGWSDPAPAMPITTGDDQRRPDRALGLEVPLAGPALAIPDAPRDRAPGLDIRAAVAEPVDPATRAVPQESIELIQALPVPVAVPDVVEPAPSISAAAAAAPAGNTNTPALPKLRFPDMARQAELAALPARPTLTPAATVERTQRAAPPVAVIVAQPDRELSPIVVVTPPSPEPPSPELVGPSTLSPTAIAVAEPTQPPEPETATTQPLAPPAPTIVTAEMVSMLPAATNGLTRPLSTEPTPAISAQSPSIVLAPSTPSTPESATSPTPTPAPTSVSMPAVDAAPTLVQAPLQPAEPSSLPAQEPSPQAVAPGVVPVEPSLTAAAQPAALPPSVPAVATVPPAPSSDEPLTFSPVTPAAAPTPAPIAALPSIDRAEPRPTTEASPDITTATTTTPTTATPGLPPIPTSEVPSLASDPAITLALNGGMVLPAPPAPQPTLPTVETAMSTPTDALVPVALPALDRRSALTPPTAPPVVDDAFAAAVAGASKKLAALATPTSPSDSPATAAAAAQAPTPELAPLPAKDAQRQSVAGARAESTPSPGPTAVPALSPRPAPTAGEADAPAALPVLARAAEREGNEVRPAPAAGSALDPFSAAAQPIALRVLELSGTPGMVQMLSEGSPDWTIAELNQQFTGKFTIRTGGDAGVLVDLDQQARLRVGRLSRVDVRALNAPGLGTSTDRRLVVALTRGRVAVVPMQGKVVNVYTPQSMIAVREPTEVIHDTAAGTRTVRYNPTGVAEVPTP